MSLTLSASAVILSAGVSFAFILLASVIFYDIFREVLSNLIDSLSKKN